jgi:hypothetical protein
MAEDTNRTSIIVGTLFKLITLEGVTFTFQNFWIENEGVFTYDGIDYYYLPIDYTPPEKNITLDNTETEINLPVTPAIVAILEANNYFIQSLIEIFTMLQGFPTVPLLPADKATVSSYSIRDDKEGGGGLTLIISSPFNALTGKVANLIYTTGFTGTSGIIGYIPEVPVSNSSGIS